jgi:peroxiredoxin
MQCSMLWFIAFSFPWGPAGQTGGPTPEAQYESLVKEYDQALNRAREALRSAKTDVQKKQAGTLFPRVEVFGPRFLALATEHPRSSVSCDALVWIVSRSRLSYDSAPSRVALMSEAMDRLVRDHVDDVRVGWVCRDLARYASPLRDTFLRSVYEKTANREVRGCACLSLAQYLMNKASLVEIARSAEGKRPESMIFITDAYFAQMCLTDPTPLIVEAELRLDETIREYGSLRGPQKKLTFAQVAALDLKQLRQIAIGKAAPDIEGADVDGHEFKLSEYRGKVVVLSFSGNWCGPCKVEYPHQRELVSRLKDRPFALLSVNTDDKKETVRDAISTGEITWKCWWDGGVLGPICRAWNVHGFPTVYVIDANGVLRHRDLHGPALDRAVEKLLTDIETSAKR